MAEAPPAGPSPDFGLSEHLEHVTEALAATTLQAEVLQIVLEPALTALGAMAGAVLLVDAGGTRLDVTATCGHEAPTQTSWQDGPLAGSVPAADVLKARQPLYFEHQGALAAAYPDLDTRAGGALPVATAVLPMVLDGRPLGAVMLDFQAPHTFTPAERRFLQTLAAQCAIALGRGQVQADLERQTDEQTRRADALTAFIAFTEAAGAASSVDTLVRQAQQVLQLTIPDLQGAYYALRGGRWVAQGTTDDLPAALREMISAGLALETASFQQAVQQRQPVFFEHWDATAQGIPYTDQFHAVALAPYFHGDEAVAMFTVGYGSAASWSDAQRELFLAVVRGLGGALERAEQRRLQERQAALNAFIALTETVGTQYDHLRLAERARDLVLAFLPGWSVGYYRREDRLWKAVLADVPDPERAALLYAGLPDDTPGYAAAVSAGAPVFFDGGDAREQRFDHTGSSGMAAFYPYFSHGRPTAMFVVGSQTSSAWTAADQAVFLAVGRSLGQALAWTTQAEELSAQNEALDAFTRFTEATADTTEIPALASRAWDVLRATLGDVSVAFYNLEDGLWQVKAWSPDVTEPFLRRMLQGFTEDTPRFVNAVRAGGPVFVPGWSTTSEGLPPDPRYGALASYPYFLDGRALSLLSVGAKDKVNWTDREEGVIRAVGRSLGLALERAQQAQQLISQRDALNLRTQDLQAANEELEAFTYSASHDLRTPVRHVMGFAELAQKALLATPNEKAHQHLEVVKQGAVRMTALIDGMLVLSRAGRDGLQPRSFALQPLVAQSIRDVGQEFPGQPVRWHLGTFPAVWGDPALVQQVMTNLLSNAVKYSGSRAVSAVKVWCEEDASEWVIRVQDNGVGFDAKYAAKLFGIFQRLHPDRDFQGTGVGLAIVRRIVVKHGGRVFAESPEAAGATFGFTLPKRSAS